MKEPNRSSVVELALGFMAGVLVMLAVMVPLLAGQKADHDEVVAELQRITILLGPVAEQADEHNRRAGNQR